MATQEDVFKKLFPIARNTVSFSLQVKFTTASAPSMIMDKTA